MLLVVSIAFLVTYAGLIFFYFQQWRNLSQPKLVPVATVRVSVLIAARNEKNTLPLLLNDLKHQVYDPSFFEVIVINDFSTDGTEQLAHNLPPHFRMIYPDCTPAESSKKKAIATGVAQARGELIMVTDADCRVGPQWVQTVASFYRQTGASFIAAPVKYTYQPVLVQLLQVLDFMTLQGITAASVAARFHAMCNGANLAYTKAAFKAVGGFAGIEQVPTGDDMLLMHKIWKKEKDKVVYLKHKDAIVLTTPMPTWGTFFMQRRRWASKTFVYDDYRIIAVLAFVLLLNVLPFVLLLAAFFNPVNLLYFLLFLVAKSGVEWPFVFSVAAFFTEKKLMRYFIWLQPLHLFYTVFVGVWSQLGGYEWKGRKVSKALTATQSATEGASVTQNQNAKPG